MPVSSPVRIDPADLVACRALLCGGSRSFRAASLLLPRRVRDPAVALYAFCRIADDLIDAAGADAAVLAALDARLDAIYRGAPEDHAADRALAAVVSTFAIPRALPAALLEGFAWDAEGRSYPTLAALHGYAARVAGTVGVMMAMLMGVRAPVLLARACDLGVAMQLSNIARDVGEDAGRGRLYLPLNWLAEAGLDAQAFLARPSPGPALAGVVARLLAEADALYARADAGIAGLPWDCRPGIAAARHLYAAIGAEVARAGHDSITQRAVVGSGRKLTLLARGIAGGLVPGGDAGAVAPLPEGAFLVHAAAAAGVWHGATAAAPRRPAWRPWPDFGMRMVWVLELFAQLERREHLQRSGG